MKITALRAVPSYRLWLRFADGKQGTVDLSEKVRRGVFASWKDPKAFAQVEVGEFGQPVWPGDIDLGSDSLYRMVTGNLPAQFLVKGEPAHA